MIHYQLSKYQDDDESWTSVSDIGSTYNNEVLTRDTYLSVEDRYISFLMEVIVHPEQHMYKVIRYEDNRGLNMDVDPYFGIDDPFIKIRGGEMLHQSILPTLFRLCMRENVWLRVERSDGSYITFGYDFYVNFGVMKELKDIEKLEHQYSLFLRKNDEDPHE